MEQQKIFTVLSIILILFKIGFIVSDLFLTKSPLSLARSIIYFSNWAYFILCASLILEDNDTLNGIAGSSVLIAALGYWCFILPGMVTKENTVKISSAIRWIPEGVLTHLVSLVVFLVAWGYEYLQVRKEETTLDGWTPFLISLTLLLLQVIIQLAYNFSLPGGLSNSLYPSKTMDYRNPLVMINLAIGVGFSACAYYFLIV
jgi:hypothetical protein